MLNLKNLLIIGILSFTFLYNCKKEESNPIKEEFAIKDINGSIIIYLPKDLLVSIHEDLLLTGREKDAESLYEIYDQKTGYLKTVNSDEVEMNVSLSEFQIDSSKMTEVNTDTLSPISTTGLKAWEQQYVYLYAHCQSYGDMGPFQQAPNDYDYSVAPYYAGTTGLRKRLEGIWLQTAQFLEPTRPTIYYSLCNPNNTWTSTATWGQFTGTRGQEKEVIGLRIWSNTQGFHIWYIAHNQTTGWTGGWHNDGQFAGSSGHRLEAYAMQILQY